jgi:membrane-associated protein
MFDYLKDIFHLLSNIKPLIEKGGMILICAIMFVETGLFIGFCLPGDSLLVTAGILAAAKVLPLGLLLSLVPLCVIVGDQVGYWIGRRAGAALYKREDSLLFKKRHLERAHEFYEKYGGKTIILARYVPIIRTFAPPVAGAARMNYRRYITFSILGGILWVWSMVLVGYGSASLFPNVDKYLHIIIVVVIFLSILPAIIEAWRQWRNKSVKIPDSGSEKLPE